MFLMVKIFWYINVIVLGILVIYVILNVFVIRANVLQVAC